MILTRTLATATMFALTAASPAWADCSVVAASDASFGTSTSLAAQTTSYQTSTTAAGLRCSGAVLSVLQSGDHVYATISSANGGLVGSGGDIISYTIYGDSTTSSPIPTGEQFDYASGSLLNLLGLFSGPATNLPLFFRTAAGANVAAGTYTDTLSIAWSWDYCTGIGLFGVCLGRDTGSGTSSFQISMVVTNACEVQTAPDIVFGQAPTAGSFASISQSVSVRCTKGLASYTVGLSAGQNQSGGRRRLRDGSAFLEYDIFKSGGSIVWGSSGAARFTNASPANGATAQLFSYEAHIYSDQTTPGVGLYSDTIVVDVAF